MIENTSNEESLSDFVARIVALSCAMAIQDLVRSNRRIKSQSEWLMKRADAYREAIIDDIEEGGDGDAKSVRKRMEEAT